MNRVAALLTFILLVSSFLGLSQLARQDSKAFMNEVRQRWESQGGRLEETGGYLDFEDNLIYEIVPNTDHTEGGVFLTGSSNVKVSILPWKLEDKIFNYSLSSLRHSQQLQFFKYLIDHHSFGGSKTTVVFGLFYHNASGIADQNYFELLFPRHGLYNYSTDKGITPVEMSSIRRWYKLSKLSIWNYLNRRYDNPITQELHLSTSFLTIDPQLEHDAEVYRDYWTSEMGDSWQENMKKELKSLQELLELLKTQGIRVKAFIAPRGSWHSGLPYPTEYQTQIKKLFPNIVDWSEALEDKEFQDSTHANYKGQLKYHNAIVELIGD